MYKTLLKTPEKLSFGHGPTQTVLNLSKPPKGEVPVSVTKLLVNWNGNEYEPIECSQVGIEFLGENTVILKIATVSDDDDSSMKIESPPVDAVIPSDDTTEYDLQGEDLTTFENLSGFRHDDNKGKKTEDSRCISDVLESNTYDIRELQSVQDAILHLVEQEKQHIDKGYKVFQVSCPKFEYTDSYNFKLTEHVVLLETLTSSNGAKRTD